MSLDPNVIIGSTLGSLIAISGSVAVAVLYIRSQNKSEKKKLLNERIQETYFEQGILQVEGAVSIYGTSVAFALQDIRRWMTRCLIHKQEDIVFLKAQMEIISRRSAVIDLTNHDFGLVAKWLPTLHKFGSSLYVSVIRTLQLYSSILSDALSLKHMQRNIEDSSIDEVTRSLGAIAQILHLAQLYLENRFTNLKDYFWKKDFESYDDFSKMFMEQKYKTFLSVINQYEQGITKLMDAMTSPKAEDRKEATLSFSRWLDKNMEYNPLE